MGRRITKTMIAWSLTLIMIISIMPSVNSPIPDTVQAAVVGRTGLTFDYKNVKSNESDYDAFVRLGKEFYNTYIKGKYTSTAAKNGGTEKVFTQDSVYALEYAMNKDILSDDAISKITSGSTKIVDLPTYAEKVHVFCTESIDKMPEARRSTNAPNDSNYDVEVGEQDREWAVAGKGAAAPDFSTLTLLGRDLLGCSNTLDYLHHYCVMDKNALWEGQYSKDGMLVNSDGNLMLGWIKLPSGDITVQGGYGSVGVSQFYNTTGYSMVMSDCRYYLIKDNILQKKNTSINFAKDMLIGSRSWYDEGAPEDRTFIWTVDGDYGVSDEDMEDMIGGQNYIYMNLAESFGFQKLFYMQDISLPKTRGTEYANTINLTNTGAAEVSLQSLSAKMLSISISEDNDGWYKNHLFYSSSDDKVATVDNTGRVYGVSEGSAVITVVAKTSGRSTPVQIKVNVTDSPNVTEKIPVGASTEDAIYLSSYSEMVLDSLPERLEDDNMAAVVIVDQPIFAVNGNRGFNPAATVSSTDKLTLERWTQTVACGTMPFEEYKRVAKKLHEQGKKLYLTIQCWWGDNKEYADVSFDESYWSRMISAYIEDPSNAEAKAFIDKMFDAYKKYFEKYGSSYAEAGVDGIILTEHDLANSWYRITDDHWSNLLSSMHDSFKGEVKAYLTENSQYEDIYLNNPYLFSNIDGLMISVSETQDYINGDYPSVKECKKIMQEHIGAFSDAMYNKYGISIDPEWWINSTVACASSHADGNVGKGRWKYTSSVDYKTRYTTSDYLQQMIMWEAALELFAEKEYTGIVYSRYNFQSWKVWNQNYDIRGGYDCTATVYRKPASKLLAAWSTGKVNSKVDPDIECKIDKIGGEEPAFSFYTMKSGDSVQLSMSPDNISYTYSSLDTSVVSVDNSGTMTAKNVGKTKITVQAEDETYGKKVFYVYVYPSDAKCDEQYGNVITMLKEMQEKGYDVSADTLSLLYEFATRINEPVISEVKISEMVDGGVFDYSTGRKYTEFVLGLRAYNITLDNLKISTNDVCKCTANDEYIYDYLVKDPYDGNYHTDGMWSTNADNNGNVIDREDESFVYGWNDFGSEDLGVVPQYLDSGDKSKSKLYSNNMIHTGDRFYFTHTWDLDRGSIKLKIYDKEFTIPLEDDGGVTEGNLQQIMDSEPGASYYEKVMEDYENDNNVEFVNPENDCRYMLVNLNIGYPTKKIFDFTCKDLVYDGTTSLSPVVDKNYSGGEVTFTYQKRGNDTWESVSPKDAGIYTVRATVAPKNGYRKTVCEKTVRITEAETDVPEVAPPLSVNAVKNGQAVDITWSKVEAASKYKVLKKLGSDGSWNTCAYVTALSYEDSDCCGQEVSYKICANVNGSYSEGSAETPTIKVPHTLSHIAATAATSEKNGNIEYYVCSSCGKCFEDSEGTKEITVESVVLEYKVDDVSEPKENVQEPTVRTSEEGTDKKDGTSEETVAPNKPADTGKIPKSNVGDTVAGDAGKATYIVTKPAQVASGSNAVTPGEVTYKSSTDKNVATVNIPSSIRTENGEVYNVTAIGDNAFKGNARLTKVTMPAGLTTIGANAFSGCKKLTSVSISNTVTKIEASAFENCTALKNVTIPASVTEIEAKAFKKCTKMTKAVIGKSVKKIGTSAFEGDSALKTISFKGAVVETIEDAAFKNCKKLSSIVIPKAVKSIGKNAFNGDKKLKKITFKGNNVKKIGKTAFKGVPKKSTAKVPKKKLKAYKKLLKKAKFTGKVKK